MKLTPIQEYVIEEYGLDLDRASSKGWINTDKECPFCGKGDEHLGIKINEDRSTYKNHISFRCLKCGETGTEFALFKQTDNLHLLKRGKTVDVSEKLENKINQFVESQEIEITSSTRPKPLGYKRVRYNEYLSEERGFEDWQYETYNIGISILDRRLKDYVIFIIEEEGECKGYVCRSTKPTKWINEYNDQVKEWNKNRPEGYKKKNKYLRYRNDDADFGKLLMGIDEITEKVKEIIIVEGVTDKSNVDRQLKLNLSSEIKCVCTFGKKISLEQIEKLKRKGVKSVILTYDPDATKDSGDIGLLLDEHFDKVKVSYTKENDPGDMTREELLFVINSAENPLSFKINKIPKKKLL